MRQMKLLVEGDGPEETLEGRVNWYNSISRSSVLFELEGKSGKRVVELTVSTPWVIRPKDRVAVAGRPCEDTGKLIAYAYANQTRKVGGCYEFPGAGMALLTGPIFVVASIFFAWAVFPLFVHLPMGLKSMKLSRDAKQLNQRAQNAAAALAPTL